MIDFNKVYNKQVLDNLTLIMRQEFGKYPIRLIISLLVILFSS